MRPPTPVAATLIVSSLAIMAGPRATGAQTAMQTVAFEVRPVNQVAVSGNPAPLVVNTATPGSAPTEATNSGTTWAITTNETNKKIIASVDQAMPAGVTLEVSLAAPPGAQSAGPVALGVAGADVVTGIPATNASALPITYRLRASSTASTTSGTRVVTFTIVSGS